MSTVSAPAADAGQTDAELLAAARASAERHAAQMGGARGVLVLEVLPETQGAAAGFRRGDILLRYGDTALDSAEALIEATSRIAEDAPVDLELLHDGEVHRVVLRGGRIGVRTQTLSLSMEKMPFEEFLAALVPALQAEDAAMIEDLLRRHGRPVTGLPR